MPSRAAPLLSFDHLALRPEDTALFLDFDGTLAEIVDHPDAVSVPPRTRRLLALLHDSTGGAVAIVTGRAIMDIDRLLEPLKLPVAGVHGLERRAATGAVTRAATDEALLGEVRSRLDALSARLPGTMVEAKPGSLVLHYRRRPELGGEGLALVHRAVEDLDGLEILPGKMVVEIKAGKATKADAVAGFMREQPFGGRFPIFAGDDVTDEHAFEEIAEHGGASIKIGAGETTAAFRAADTEEFRDWLTLLSASFEQRQLAG